MRRPANKKESKAKASDKPEFAGAQESLTQLDKFKQAARELECDDDEAAFRAKLKKLTEAPPPESVQERKGKSVLKARVAGKKLNRRKK